MGLEIVLRAAAGVVLGLIGVAPVLGLIGVAPLTAVLRVWCFLARVACLPE